MENIKITLPQIPAMKITLPGQGGTPLKVDSEMSDTSTNPVQNKVAKKYVEDAIKQCATKDLARTEKIYDAFLKHKGNSVYTPATNGINIGTIYIPAGDTITLSIPIDTPCRYSICAGASENLVFTVNGGQQKTVPAGMCKLNSVINLSYGGAGGSDGYESGAFTYKVISGVLHFSNIKMKYKAKDGLMSSEDKATLDAIPDTYATKEELGNIETALDSIIAIQEGTNGGDDLWM